MMEWLGLFVSPSGRIGQRTFWHGWIVILLANVLLIYAAAAYAAAPGALPRDRSWAAPLGPLLTLYPMICVHAKRLRHLGLSPWLQAPARVFWVVAAGMLAVPNAWDQNPASIAFWVLLPVGVLADAALLLWCGLRPGPPPPRLAEVFD